MSASAVIVLQKSTQLSTLLEERLGVKGHCLDTRLRQAARDLPRDVLNAGRRIAMAEYKARADGRIIEIDPHQFDDDYRLCLRRIEALKTRSARPMIVGGIQSSLVAMVSVVMLYAGMVGNFFFN